MVDLGLLRFYSVSYMAGGGLILRSGSGSRKREKLNPIQNTLSFGDARQRSQIGIGKAHSANSRKQLFFLCCFDGFLGGSRQFSYLPVVAKT